MTEATTGGYRCIDVSERRARALAAQGVSLRLAELRNEVAEKLRTSGAEKGLRPIEAHLTVEPICGPSGEML